MTVCDILFFALLTFVISTSSAQLRLRKSSKSEADDISSAGSRSGSAVLCSEAGNCTCLFEKFHVAVKCTSAGDKLDEIASELPQNTTHL